MAQPDFYSQPRPAASTISELGLKDEGEEVFNDLQGGNGRRTREFGRNNRGVALDACIRAERAWKTAESAHRKRRAQFIRKRYRPVVVEDLVWGMYGNNELWSKRFNCLLDNSRLKFAPRFPAGKPARVAVGSTFPIRDGCPAPVPGFEVPVNVDAVAVCSRAGLDIEAIGVDERIKEEAVFAHKGIVGLSINEVEPAKGE